MNLYVALYTAASIRHDPVFFQVAWGFRLAAFVLDGHLNADLRIASRISYSMSEFLYRGLQLKELSQLAMTEFGFDLGKSGGLGYLGANACPQEGGSAREANSCCNRGREEVKQMLCCNLGQPRLNSFPPDQTPSRCPGPWMAGSDSLRRAIPAAPSIVEICA